MMIVATITVLVVKMRWSVGDSMVREDSNLQTRHLRTYRLAALHMESRPAVKQPFVGARWLRLPSSYGVRHEMTRQDDADRLRLSIQRFQRCSAGNQHNTVIKRRANLAFYRTGCILHSVFSSRFLLVDNTVMGASVPGFKVLRFSHAVSRLGSSRYLGPYRRNLTLNMQLLNAALSIHERLWPTRSRGISDAEPVVESNVSERTKCNKNLWHRHRHAASFPYRLGDCHTLP